MHSMGIDASVQSTGVIVLKAETDCHVPQVVCEKIIKHPKLKGHERQSAICSDLIDLWNKFRPDEIVIEGYGLNFKHATSVVPLVELGGLIRYFLRQYDYSYVNPSPSEVKKFATGKGVGDKKVIMGFVEKRWAFKALNNDTADAFVLAMMGVARANLLLGLSQDEREIVYSLKTC